MNLSQAPRSSPFFHNGNRTSLVMLKVILVLLIPLALWVHHFGVAALVQITLALVTGMSCEWLALKLRGLPIKPFLKDYSTPLAMLLLAFCIPPSAPWWVIVIAATTAILLAKHAYGGIGNNVFNPAMAGYAVVLISFPQELASWPLIIDSNSIDPSSIDLGSIDLSWKDWLLVIFSNNTNTLSIDAYSGATLLAQLRLHEVIELTTHQQFWFWLNALALGSGILLLLLRIITWHIPIAFMGSIFFTSALIDGLFGIAVMPITWQLWTGATMLGAFFILTDPVSSATSPSGKLIYAGLAGLLVVVIRTWGNYPDAVCFAVLIANMIVPVLDHYCLPKNEVMVWQNLKQHLKR